MNIATEFNKFKDILFNKKIVRHKMKRTQGKKHKLRTYRGLLGIYMLVYFQKDSVTSCKKI